MAENKSGKVVVNLEWFEGFIATLCNLYDKYDVLTEFRLMKFTNDPHLTIELSKGKYHAKQFIPLTSLMKETDKVRYLEVVIEHMLHNLLEEENK